MSTEGALVLPDLSTISLAGIPGTQILWLGVLVCAVGLGFGLWNLGAVKRLGVHPALQEISELIYATCRTYLKRQARLIFMLEALIAAMIILYFGVLQQLPVLSVALILGCSILGILGSIAVAWFGIRVNNYANARTAFASLTGKALPVYRIPLQAGMSIGLAVVSVALMMLLLVVLTVPGELADHCFIGFAIGASLGASVLRIAGGIFTKIADIGADLMKIVFKIKEDDARNPGVIADCAGDNAGDSLGPSADGFETYGVTIVALVSYLTLAVHEEVIKQTLLVWVFAIGIAMLATSLVAYLINDVVAKSRYAASTRFNFEVPLTVLVWLTSVLSIAVNVGVSYALLRELPDPDLWWKISLMMSCGTLAGALIPEVIKVFTSTSSGHVREVVDASREGGASLNVLSGLVAGNFSAFWMGLVLIALMGGAYGISTLDLEQWMSAPAVLAFGLVAFGFLGMAPVTIAVDSYGPVTDNAQSVYELSLIEQLPGIETELEKTHGFKPNFDRAKDLLEENDGAGNTFKATAKPVLIGTAVAGATTMIFSIIVVLTKGLSENLEKLSILHPPFLLGLIAGGAIIYWFTGASMQAVTTGAHRAVQFIKSTIKLDASVTKASAESSSAVVAICTEYAQKGMINIFITVFLATLSFACAEPFFFIGYLISLALFGFFQSLFMANAGGAWDNAKKVVEVELKAKGTALHDAVVVGDTVGDPFKDTSSVAMNPVIKFATLFGLLALNVALSLEPNFRAVLSAALFAIALCFVWRSFYGMRITTAVAEAATSASNPILSPVQNGEG